jgi:hypothetical protein
LESFPTRLDQAGIRKWRDLSPAQQAELESVLHPDIVKEFRQTGSLNHPLVEADYLFVEADGKIRLGLPRRVDNFADAVYKGRVFRKKPTETPPPDDTMPTRPAAAPEDSGVRSKSGADTETGRNFSNFSPQEQAARAVRDLEYVYDFLNDLRAQNGYRHAPPTSPVKVRGSKLYVSDLSGEKARLQSEGIEFEVGTASEAAALLNHIAKNAGDLGQLSIPLKVVRRNGPNEIILETPSGRPIFVRVFDAPARAFMDSVSSGPDKQIVRTEVNEQGVVRFTVRYDLGAGFSSEAEFVYDPKVGGGQTYAPGSLP